MIQRRSLQRLKSATHNGFGVAISKLAKWEEIADEDHKKAEQYRL